MSFLFAVSTSFVGLVSCLFMARLVIHFLTTMFDCGIVAVLLTLLDVVDVDLFTLTSLYAQYLKIAFSRFSRVFRFYLYVSVGHVFSKTFTEEPI